MSVTLDRHINVAMAQDFRQSKQIASRCHTNIRGKSTAKIVKAYGLHSSAFNGALEVSLGDMLDINHLTILVSKDVFGMPCLFLQLKHGPLTGFIHGDVAKAGTGLGGFSKTGAISKSCHMDKLISKI